MLEIWGDTADCGIVITFLSGLSSVSYIIQLQNFRSLQSFAMKMGGGDPGILRIGGELHKMGIGSCFWNGGY